MTPSGSPLLPRLFAAGVALLVFGIDLMIPLGVAAGAPYILSILILWRWGPANDLLLASLLCSVLTAVGFFLSPEGGEPAKVLANRMLAVFAVFAVAFVGRSARKVEAHLERAKVLYQDLYDNAPDLFCSINAQTAKIEQCNETLVKALGFTKEELIGESIFFLYPERIHEEVKTALLLFQETGEVRNAELRLQRKDGTELDVMLSVSAIRDETGKIIRSRSIWRDITARKEYLRSLREMNAQLESQVAERTEELNQANETLQSRNQDLRAFVYSVSHDMRSPLVNIDGFSGELEGAIDDILGILDQGPLDEPRESQLRDRLQSDVKECVHFIKQGVKRLSGIIQALLKLSRIGELEHRKDEVALSPIVHAIVDALQTTIQEKGATLELSELPSVKGDQFTLEQVLANLIENALKYLDSNRPGVISIDCEPPQEGTVTIRVRDNGLGIPPGARERVFQALKRAHPDVAAGEGIGLSIVKRIVERHHGEIWLESEEGVGTTFYVKLPIWEGGS